MNNKQKILSIIAMLIIIVGSIIYYEAIKVNRISQVLVVDSYEANEVNMKGKQFNSYDLLIDFYIKIKNYKNVDIAKGKPVIVGNQKVYPTLVVYPDHYVYSDKKTETLPYIVPIFVVEKNGKYELFLNESIQDSYQDKVSKSFVGKTFGMQNQFGTFKYYIKHDEPLNEIKGERFKFPKYNMEIVKVYNNKKSE